MGSDITVEHEIDVAKLNKLLDEATRGPWRIDRGLMADSLWITAYEREGIGRKDGDGPICHVSQTKRHYESNRDRFGNRRGKSRSWETPIKKARTDAELIVAAVNALPELLRRLKLDIDEIGEPSFVIDSNDATRFARKVDAEAVIRAEKLKGVKATEHMWMTAVRRENAAA